MKLDPKFTASMQSWLNTPAERRDMAAGAMLLFQANRNRALYNSIVARPAKFAAKLEYEMRKHLKIRLAKMSLEDVVRMDASVMPRVERTVATEAVISTDDELPKGAVAKGKRPDHDTLPAEIQQLWDDNAQRYRKVRALFEELKAMSDAEPCDRYEKLVILDKEETAYRTSLAAYDAYGNEPDGLEKRAADQKRVSALRKSLSTHRKQLGKLPEDDAKRSILLDKIQAEVSELAALGSGIADGTKIELAALGIKFE